MSLRLVDNHQASMHLVHWSELFLSLEPYGVLDLLHLEDLLPTDSFLLVFNQHSFNQLD